MSQTQTEFDRRAGRTPQTAGSRNQRQIQGQGLSEAQLSVRLINTEPDSTLYVFTPNGQNVSNTLKTRERLNKPAASNAANARNIQENRQPQLQQPQSRRHQVRQRLQPPRKDGGTVYLAPPRQSQSGGSVAVIQVPVRSQSVVRSPRDVNETADMKNEVKKPPTVKRLADKFKKNGLNIIDSYFNAWFFYCQYYKSKNEKNIKEKTGAENQNNGRYGAYLAFLAFIAGLWGFILDILSPVRSLIKLTEKFLRCLERAAKTPKSIGVISRKICGFAIPAAAVAFTAMTIINISAYKPELELYFNGQAAGFVDSKETVAKVVSLIENNVSSVLNEKYEFPGKFSYRIVLAKETSYISESGLYYLMYSSSETQGTVTKAYGLFIDGALVGAAESESEINRILNEVLAANSSGGDGETVEFANDIKIIPNNYAARDVVSQDELKNIITYSVGNTGANTNANADTDGQYYEVEIADAEIPTSGGNGLFQDEPADGSEDIAAAAAAMAVSLAPETINTIPRGFLASDEDSGENRQTQLDQNELLSRLSKTTAGITASAIQFKKTRTETYSTETPFETKYIESNQYFTGTQTVRTNGANGESIITAEVTYIGEDEVSREIKEIEVVKEPVAKVVVVGTKARPSSAPTGKFIRPVKGGYISSRHGNGHRGIDLVVPYGTSIAAADGGTVIYAGYSGSYGNHIKIKHNDGFVTIYAHNSSNLVKSGDKVYQGQEIGKVGSTGNSSGNHLHFEIMKNGVLVNPESYIK